MAMINNPFEITQGDWDDPEYEHYDKVFVDYNSENDVLTGIDGIVYDEEDRAAIGEENIRSLIDNEDCIIQIRNDNLEIDFEITRQ